VLSTLKWRGSNRPAAALAAWRAADEPAGGTFLAADRGQPTAVPSTSPAPAIRWRHVEVPAPPTWSGPWTGCGAVATPPELAINGGVGAQLRGQLAFVGYKGGSSRA
jgi:hypothetical protein